MEKAALTYIYTQRGQIACDSSSLTHFLCMYKRTMSDTAAT